MRPGVLRSTQERVGQHGVPGELASGAPKSAEVILLATKQAA
jgi:hypothetical protein